MRILVIEESWPKKFNLPQSVWAHNYSEPKDVYKYYRVRREIDPDGTVLISQNAWIDYLASRAVAANPRLQNDIRKTGSPYILNSPLQSEQPQNVLSASPYKLSPNAQ